MKKREGLPHKQAGEAIAIVGMSCRFPGAPNPQAFWKLLAEGRNAISEVSDERWNHKDYYAAEAGAAGKTNQKHGAFIEGIQDFDPLFFNISPREAADMNPAQMLSLALAWEAIEDCSIPYNKIEGSNTGVYMGSCWYEYERARIANNAPTTQHTALGQATNLIANRISYSFGFTGPSLVLDTGCSASLFALHLACQALRDGSIDAALAGGVNTLLDPNMYVAMTHFGALSPDGKCFSFDARGNGYVRGEGAGIVMLKRLADAERDGDKIYAVIKGSALNNNGYNQNLPATSIKGQIEVLEKAYEDAGIEPSQVHYVEAHGTGTRVGDPTETKALGSVFGKNRSLQQPLHIGSVKTNIGHLEGAAGIAGLLKVVLAMQHKKLPMNLNFEHPNPEIPFTELKLKVQQQLEKWPAAEAMVAGVNSFGWGGTNAHVVLQEYKPKCNNSAENLSDKTAYTLPISAKSEEALHDLVAAYHKTLVEKVNGSRLAFAELCAATAIKRPSFEYKVAFTAENKQQMLEQLQEFCDAKEEIQPVNELGAVRKTVFVFPGQGGQWLGMGKSLYREEPVFKEAIDACDKAFAVFTSWSLLEQLMADEANSRLKDIEVIQPYICAIQIAMAKLWQSWGVKPDAVVGHSMGEVASAFIAGAISLEDAALIICKRSQLMKKMSGKGAMAVTELTAAEAEKVAAAYKGKLSVAVHNSPKSTVLSGDGDALRAIVADLDAKGVFARLVKVDVASHSYQMDPIKEELHQALQKLHPQTQEVTIYSTVKNAKVAGSSLDADYWVNNLRGTVKFASVIQQLLEDGAYTFVEISPHPVLSAAIKDCKEAYAKEALIVHSTHREEGEYLSMLNNLSLLYQKGHPINWQAFYQHMPCPHYHLPAHPMYPETFAMEVGEKSAGARMVVANTEVSQLQQRWLEPGMQLADEAGTTYYQTKIGHPIFESWLHTNALGNKVLAGGVLLEILHTALVESGHTNYRLHTIDIEKQTEVDQHTIIQLKLVQQEQVLTILFFSKKEKAAWCKVAEGTVALNPGPAQTQVSLSSMFAANSAGALIISGATFYNQLAQKGVLVAEKVQCLQEVRIFSNQIVARISNPSNWQAQTYFGLHPALLQTCFHTLSGAAVFSANAVADTVLAIENFRVYQQPDYSSDCWLLVKFTNQENQQKQASIMLLQDNGLPLWSFTAMLKQDIAVSAELAAQLKNKIQTAPAVDKEEKALVVETVLKDAVAATIKSSPARIRMNLSFKKLGVDSLMAVQLKNRLNDKLGLSLLVTSFWSVSTLAEYACFIEQQLSAKQLADVLAAVPAPAKAEKAVVALQPATSATYLTKDQLEELLKLEVAGIIKSSPARVKTNLSFKKLGIDSMMAVQLKNRLNAKLAINLSVASFWAYPSISEFLTFLSGQLAQTPMQEMLQTVCQEVSLATPLAPATLISEEDRLNSLSLEDLAKELDQELKDLL